MSLARPRPGTGLLLTLLGMVPGSSLPGQDCNENGRPDAEEVAPRLRFEPLRRISVRAERAAIATADFDLDGVSDLVTTNGEEVAILLGTGRGMFRDSVGFEAGRNLESLVQADWNEDGFPDLAFADSILDFVTTYLGRGDGTFGSSRTTNVDDGPFNMTASDWNEDGHVDFATCNRVSNSISLVLGRGDGTFLPRRSVPTGLEPLALATADLDSDDRMDLFATCFQSGGVAVHYGNGTGGFTTPLVLMGPPAVQSTAAGDWNNDGRMDLATGDGVGNGVALHLNTGERSFGEAQIIASGKERFSIGAADFDADGKMDLVTSARAPNASLNPEVSVHLGRGDGRFLEPVNFAVSSGRPFELIAADLDANGFTDIATANEDTESITLLLNRSMPPYSTDCNGNGVPDSCEVRDGATADCNEDGLPDACPRAPLHFTQDFALPVEDEPIALATGDFDMDGVVDLASANVASNDVAVLLGLPAGTFQEPRTFPVGPQPTTIVALDEDRDGDLDLVTYNRHTIDLSLLGGNGDGGFQAARAYPPGTEPGLAFEIDANGDGVRDIAVRDTSAGDLALLIGGADGVARAPGNHVPPVPEKLILLSDIDGDEAMDSLTTTPGGGHGTLRFGTSQGGLGDTETIAWDAEVIDAIHADIDSDGLKDLVTRNYIDPGYARDVSLLVRDPSRGFLPPRSVSLMENPNTLMARDFDMDGRLEVAVAAGLESVYVLASGEGGELRTASRRDSAGYPLALASSDWDGDGKPDIATANVHADSVRLYFFRGGPLQDVDANGTPDECEGGRQVPGDCNQDGALDLSDGLCVLGVLFLGAPAEFPCATGTASDSANLLLLDWEPNGELTISDAIRLLTYIFDGGPAAPLAVPGFETTGCRSIPGCDSGPGC